MRTRTTFGISFFIKKYKANKGFAPIYVRITVNAKSIDLAVKRKVEVEKWDPGKENTKGKTLETIELNNFLGTVRTKMFECRDQLEREHKLVTAKAIKSRYTGEDRESTTLLQLVSYHNKEMVHELKPGTLKNYRTTEKYIKKFLKEKLKTSDIYLQELNYNFIKSFERFIKSTPLQKKNPCTQNGTMKHMERLCKMVNLAIKEEWIIKDPFIKYELKFEKTSRRYLDEDELMKIENITLTSPALSRARDIFIFACYTGQSYIEIYNLSENEFMTGIDGDPWIKGQRQKSDEFYGVPLLPKAEAILKKYVNHPIVLNTEKSLPVYSNQKMNQYLKDVAKLCGIRKSISFYAARHTFATTVTLANDIPIETVSQMLGHTKLSTTQIYAKVLMKKVSKDMSKLKEKMNANSNLAINQ